MPPRGAPRPRRNSGPSDAACPSLVRELHAAPVVGAVAEPIARPLLQPFERLGASDEALLETDLEKVVQSLSHDRARRNSEMTHDRVTVELRPDALELFLLGKPLDARLELVHARLQAQRLLAVASCAVGAHQGI